MEWHLVTRPDLGELRVMKREAGGHFRPPQEWWVGDLEKCHDWAMALLGVTELIWAVDGNSVVYRITTRPLGWETVKSE